MDLLHLPQQDSGMLPVSTPAVGHQYSVVVEPADDWAEAAGISELFIWRDLNFTPNESFTFLRMYHLSI